MSADSYDIDPNEIARQIIEARNAVADLNNKIKENEEVIAPIEKEENELKERLHKLAGQKREAKIRAQTAKTDVKMKEQELLALQRKLREAQLRETARLEFASKSKELDELTKTAGWREFAYDHQIEGAKRIALMGGRALLGDKRGLGKTLTSLIAADMLKARKVLIFAPKETIKNFDEEIRHWAKDRTLITLIGMDKKFRDLTLKQMLPRADEFIITINLEAWRKDKELIWDLIKLQPDTVIIDEAHYIKETDKVAFKGIKKIVSAINQCIVCGSNELEWLTASKVRELEISDQYKGLWRCKDADCHITYDHTEKDIHSVRHVIPMTGTPLLNKPEEIFALLNLVDEDRFPDKSTFLYEYCTKRSYETLTGGTAWRWEFKYGGQEKLAKKIGPQFIQRDRHSAGVHIPPQTIQYYDIDMDPEKYPEQYKGYQDLKQSASLVLNDDVIPVANYIITLILRWRQMTSWPAGIELKDPNGNPIFKCDIKQSAKLDKAVELASQFHEEGERTIIFSQFTAPLEEMYRRLNAAGIRTALYHGATADHKRLEIRHDFDIKHTKNGHHKYDVVLCNYKTAGQSLNLTGATQTIILDQEWNPGKQDQAFGRNDRLGQTKNTTVHILGINNTIDMLMRELINEKGDMIEGFETQAALITKLREGLAKGEI